MMSSYENIINQMATISVPLSAELEEKLDNLVKSGVASTKSEVMRKALDLLAEREAINVVLQSEREISEGKILRGDLRKIMRRISP